MKVDCHQYKNPFFTRSNPYSVAILTGDYIETHGDLTIYSRWDHWAETFDVVRDGVCIAMRAGLEGARRYCKEQAS